MNSKLAILGLVVVLASSLFLMGACKQTVSVCGDRVCDPTESCACQDCSKDPKCAGTKVIGTCDDQNPCTEDAFNEVTGLCEHKKLPTCCGNGNCEEGERCDLTTYQTKCPKDCPLDCPPKVSVTKYSCATSRCEETETNKFTITGTSVIKATLENIGERSTDIVTSNFRCGGSSGISVVSRDKDSIFGITFRDYFGSGDQTTYVNSRVSEAGNKVDYKLSFDITKLERPTELRCEISLQAQPELNNIQVVYLSFK